jgi:Protein of unknown function (DUF3153)
MRKLNLSLQAIEDSDKIEAIEENNMEISVGRDQIVSLMKQLLSLINRRLAILFCAIAIALSSCVKYDTSVNFASLNYGEIVEHIQLDEQLNSFSQAAVKRWVDSIEQRVQQAEGKIERINDQELKIVIPFNNSQQLVAKIDSYFNPDPVDRANPTNNRSPKSSQFNAHMQIEQNNFLFMVRNHLIYDVDLRSLAIKSSDPKVSVAAQNIVDLNFSIQSPWGVKSSNAAGSIMGNNTTNDHQMNWQLRSGELNHIDATFWLPNPLGIGAILIVLISGGGYYLKYRT